MPKQEINLLPPERRKAINQEISRGRVNQALDSLLMGLMLMTVVGVGLLISYFFIDMLQPKPPLAERDAVEAKNKELRETVAEQRHLLDQAVRAGEQRVAWSEIIREVANVLPPAQVSEMHGKSELKEGYMQEAAMTVIGRAPTRVSLTSVTQRLKDLEVVTDVQSPASNLLESVNPRFELILSIKGSVL